MMGDLRLPLLKQKQRGHVSTFVDPRDQPHRNILRNEKTVIEDELKRKMDYTVSHKIERWHRENLTRTY